MFFSLGSRGGGFPTSSGAGFFTPDASQASNVLRNWRADQAIPQPFRINNNRDSMYVVRE